MQKWLFTISLVGLLVAFHHGCYGQSFELNAGIVKVSAGAPPPGVPSRKSSSVEIAPNTYLLRWSGSSQSITAEADTLQVIGGLETDSEVQYAHPNWELSLAGDFGDPGYEPPEYYPSDTLFPDQWTFSNSGWSIVWNYWTSGSSSVTIGVIDTGKTDHSDLIDKWHPFLEYNAVNQSFDAEDNGTWAHGTAVSSVAAAETYNNEGVVGACPYCSLVPIKVSDDSDGGQILLSYLVDAIDWARENQLDVINLSLEGPGSCSDPDLSALQDVITSAVADGVVVVAAAGNSSSNASGVYPASCQDVVAVAALDQSFTLAPYSNYGSVDVAAPAGGGTLTSQPFSGYGEGIGCPADPYSLFQPFQLGALVAWKTSPSGGNAYCYRYLSGTSLAAPFVAGMVGMMRSVNTQITPAEVLQVLIDNGDQSSTNCPQGCGAGNVHYQWAIYSAHPYNF